MIFVVNATKGEILVLQVPVTNPKSKNLKNVNLHLSSRNCLPLTSLTGNKRINIVCSVLDTNLRINYVKCAVLGPEKHASVFEKSSLNVF